ncbi:capsid protein [Dipodfec virus UA23Rod_1805]|uniref:Capsid protein n=1 Tax=Dipodfec virus UA23Rod_1805 TaxID=2929287 RepID=A0A976N2J7_9CIRC|nr:capsid protein [Dipodfec virus UA23Rod_1805]UPW41510.1 capsid protein [Dipodfec virus UA23Rod_1805]
MRRRVPRPFRRGRFRASRSRFYRQRVRTRRNLRTGGKFFTRIYEAREFKPKYDGTVTSPYGHLYELDIRDIDNAEQANRFRRIASLFQEYKVHKVAVKITPHINASDGQTQIGPYAVATYYQPNSDTQDQSSTIGDAKIQYENVVGLPNSKVIRGCDPTTLVFVPRMYTPGYSNVDGAGTVAVGSAQLVPTNRVWLNTKRLFPNSNIAGQTPQFYGFVIAHQGFSEIGTGLDTITYTIDIFYYVTFRKYKNTMLPVS